MEKGKIKTLNWNAQKCPICGKKLNHIEYGIYYCEHCGNTIHHTDEGWKREQLTKDGFRYLLIKEKRNGKN